MEEKDEMKKVSEKVGKLCYAIYFAGQLCFYVLVGIYVNTFMTDIGIPLAAVGLILVIARVWDAVNDPIFGIIVDKARWKSGNKYLPWIKMATGLITVFTIATFACPASLSAGVKTVWVGITYICWGMSYTMCDIPIYALPTAMTEDIKERSVIISFGRMACTIGGGFITLLFPVLRSSLGWTTTGIIFAVTGALLMIPSFAIKETNKVESDESMKLSQILSNVAHNKYLLIFYGAMIISGCLNFGTVTALYFARYCLGSEAKASVVSLCTMIPSFAVMMIVPVLIKKLDKFNIYVTALAASAALGIIRYFAGFENERLFYILLVIQGIFAAFQAMLAFMFTPDCIEYGNFVNRYRSTGIMFSVQTFTSKLTSAISGALCMAVLGFFGFATGENAVQSATAINGIWACTALIPSIGTAVSIIVLLFYKLRDRSVQIMAEANLGRISREEAIRQLQKAGFQDRIDGRSEESAEAAFEGGEK